MLSGHSSEETALSGQHSEDTSENPYPKTALPNFHVVQTSAGLLIVEDDNEELTEPSNIDLCQYLSEENLS